MLHFMTMLNKGTFMSDLDHITNEFNTPFKLEDLKAIVII